MPIHRRYTLTIIAYIATSFATISIASLPILTFAQQQQLQQWKFIAKLTGIKQVSSKYNIEPSGNAEFISNIDGSTMFYALKITNVNNVTMGHIHVGKIGEDGPIVATLFKSVPPGVFRVIEGSYLLAQGNLVPSDLEGPLAGKQISHLVNIMKNGQTYVDVHTDQIPNRERTNNNIKPNLTTSTTPR
ncbi:MAG TPA: CHRD domain-containing protein [Nitrososphaeraceae archaeon]|nr:CHRD domain-containing protein [Nitrososphaeraceae archaeon]